MSDYRFRTQSVGSISDTKDTISARSQQLLLTSPMTEALFTCSLVFTDLVSHMQCW